MAGSVRVRLGRQGRSSQGSAGLGKARQRAAWQAWFGAVGPVEAWRGAVRHGKARYGMAGSAGTVAARHRSAVCGMLRHVSADNIIRLWRRCFGTAALIEKEGGMSVYRWREGTRIGVSAQVAGEECERIEVTRGLTPRTLVDESRPEDAPLHPAFEWRDDVAAERYREEQARHIIRTLVVEMEEVEQPARAFVSIDVGEESGRSYQNIRAVLLDASSTQAMLSDAKRELASFKRKYSELRELAGVFAAIDSLGAE